jgi:hypothetical protein
LIENASDRDPAPPPAVSPEAFPIKAATIPHRILPFASSNPFSHSYIVRW